MATGSPPDLRAIKHSELTDLKVIGSGGFGVVYRAKHKRFGTVVYKKLNAEAIGERVLDGLWNEARTCVLKHNNIVALLAIIVESGHYGLVMEHVLHGPLFDFIYIYVVGWPLKLSFAYDIVCGMKYLHSKQPPVIHSDLKPDNVLVSDMLVAKICDFGLAKWKEHAATQTAAAAAEAAAGDTGRRCGTLMYMAPEVFVDPSSPRTVKYDVYAFGILLWELFSEKQSYENERLHEILVMSAVKEGRRPSLDEIDGPTDLSSFVKKWIPLCWSQLPDDRPTFDDLEKPFAEISRAQSANSVRIMPPRRKEDAENVRLKDGQCWKRCRPQLLNTVRVEGGMVTGVTVLGHIMYVVLYGSSTILMYSVDTFRRLDSVIQVDGMGDPRDIVVCPVDRQLYVADWESCVWRVSADDHKYMKWLSAPSSPDTFRPYTLSMTSRRLLVTSRYTRTLHQYNADRELLCTVSLPEYVKELYHGVETTHDTFVVSHRGTSQDRKQYAVSEVDKTGAVLSTFTDVRGPWHLSVDNNDCVLVTDCNNHRIVLLNSQLQFRRVFISNEPRRRRSLASVFLGRNEPQVDLWWPYRLHYNERTARMYIVHHSSEWRWSSDVISVFQL